MKYLFLLLFTPFFMNAQVLESTEITDGELVRIIEDSTSLRFTIFTLPKTFDAITFDQSIIFSDEKSSVTFTKGNISFSTTNMGELVRCDPRIFELINKVLINTEKERYQRLSQLQLRVYWYEKHFGTLEGDMTDDCIEFNPVKNPPNIQPCKDKK